MSPDITPRMYDDTVEAMMSDLNRSLVGQKPSLESMHEGDVRSYVTRDGAEVIVPKEQVDYLWDVCDDSERIRLRLPIYVRTDVTGTMGAWRVDGKIEAGIVARILGKPMFRDDSVRLYNPDLKELRKKIPDCIMILFTV